MPATPPFASNNDNHCLKHWLSTAVGSSLHQQQLGLVKSHFSAALHGPQYGLVTTSQGFDEALAELPGCIQQISPAALQADKPVDQPAASLHSIIIPYAFEGLAPFVDCLDELERLLAPGGKLLLTGINPRAMASKSMAANKHACSPREAIQLLKERHYSVITQRYQSFGGPFYEPQSSPTVSSSLIASSLMLNWAILFQQQRPGGTLVGRLKQNSQPSRTAITQNRQL